MINWRQKTLGFWNFIQLVFFNFHPFCFKGKILEEKNLLSRLTPPKFYRGMKIIKSYSIAKNHSIRTNKKKGNKKIL